LTAIDYAKKQLSKFDQDPELLVVLSKILGFVAFHEDRRKLNINYNVISPRLHMFYSSMRTKSDGKRFKICFWRSQCPSIASL